MKIEGFQSLLFGALASRFFQPLIVGRKRCFQTLRLKAWRPDGLVGLSVLQQCSLFKFLFGTLPAKTVAKALHRIWLCGTRATANSVKLRIFNGILVALQRVTAMNRNLR